MEGNSALDDLLVRFILQELDEDEIAFVQGYINASEKNRRYYESLEKTWKLSVAKETFDAIDVDSEWLFFEQAVTREGQKLVPVKPAEVLQEAISVIETPAAKSGPWRIAARIAIAASLIIATVWLWKLLDSNSSPVPRFAAETGKTIPSNAVVKKITNNGRRVRKLVLPDGSVVLLSPGSEIRYKEPYAPNRRDITLNGKAVFTVAKDSTRPFTVFSQDLATTAIGTHFMVSAFENAKNYSVRLYEGKIVVRSANLVNRTLKYDYYMHPGQELVYNHVSYEASLNNFYERKKVPRKEVRNELVQQDEPLIPDHLRGTWYMFNNQSLADVFDQLQTMFDVKIEYSRKEVSNIYFIGRFEKTESINTILSQITTLNKLKLTYKDNRYQVTR